MMKPMSFSETIFLFFLALIIFGPKKLPEIARQIGKALNEFRRASNEFKAQIEQEIHNLDVENKKAEAQKQASLPPSSESAATPASLTTGLAPEGTASRSSSSSVSADATAESNSSAPIPSATLAASSEHQVASHAGEPATEALPGADASASGLPNSDLPASDVSASDPVTTSTAQESHV
jgi:TatA/E family protein of Tat protein translocase